MKNNKAKNTYRSIFMECFSLPLLSPFIPFSSLVSPLSLTLLPNLSLSHPSSLSGALFSSRFCVSLILSSLSPYCLLFYSVFCLSFPVTFSLYLSLFIALSLSLGSYKHRLPFSVCVFHFLLFLLFFRIFHSLFVYCSFILCSLLSVSLLLILSFCFTNSPRAYSFP